MRLESIIKIIQPLVITGPDNPDVTGITCDSRRVQPGFLFVALKGHHVDGASYIEDALNKGASVIVSERTDWKRPDVSHVCVEDAQRALAEISCAYYGDPSSRLQMIGVTGTNGKTTTSFMSKAILESAGRAPGMIGTVWYEMGQRRIPAGRTTPEAPELQALLDKMISAGCKSAVMEVSSHALDQKRVWGIDYDVGVFTNLSQDHLDYHHDLESYFAAKARLFRGLGHMQKKAVAAINIDDPWGMRLAGINGYRVQVITFGLHPAADVRAEDVQVTRAGSAFRLITPWGQVPVNLSLTGRFNISNALAAATACGSLGIDVQVIADALASIGNVPGRLESIANQRGINVYVDYAHTPDALKNVLETLREFTRRRIIVVFGCGGDRDRAKRPRMAAEVEQLADYAIVTNDNPRTEDPAAIAREVLTGFQDADAVECILDRRKAIARAILLAERGDTVLIAGKGHENYQEFGNTVVSFDDRETARSLLA